jgi:hypothetical protein
MATDLASMVLKAYNTKWTYINNFTVQFHAGDTLWGTAGCDNRSVLEGDDLNLYIKGINTPQMSYNVIQEYVGAQYFTATGKKEPVSGLSISFRDYNQCSLYRSFCKLWQAQDLLYLDEIGMSIDVYKDADYASEGLKHFLHFPELVIESVSQMQWSNETESQIAEFDVSFRGPYVEIY